MNRLYRSNENRVIGGVCGGIGEIMNVDPLLIRLFWVALTVLGGSGFLAYIIAWIIIPTRSSVSTRAVSNGGWFLGLLFILLGVALMFKEIWLPWSFSLPILDIGPPVFLIALGLLIVFAMYRDRNRASYRSDPADFDDIDSSSQGGKRSYRQLFRSNVERKFLGVCGGIAEYFGIDPVIIRITFVVLVFVSAGFMILLYLLMAIFVPAKSYEMV